MFHRLKWPLLIKSTGIPRGTCSEKCPHTSIDIDVARSKRYISDNQIHRYQAERSCQGSVLTIRAPQFEPRLGQGKERLQGVYNKIYQSLPARLSFRGIKDDSIYDSARSCSQSTEKYRERGDCIPLGSPGKFHHRGRIERRRF